MWAALLMYFKMLISRGFLKSVFHHIAAGVFVERIRDFRQVIARTTFLGRLRLFGWISNIRMPSLKNIPSPIRFFPKPDFIPRNNAHRGSVGRFFERTLNNLDKRLGLQIIRHATQRAFEVFTRLIGFFLNPLNLVKLFTYFFRIMFFRCLVSFLGIFFSLIYTWCFNFLLATTLMGRFSTIRQRLNLFNGTTEENLAILETSMKGKAERKEKRFNRLAQFLSLMVNAVIWSIILTLLLVILGDSFTVISSHFAGEAINWSSLYSWNYHWTNYQAAVIHLQQWIWEHGLQTSVKGLADFLIDALVKSNPGSMPDDISRVTVTLALNHGINQAFSDFYATMYQLMENVSSAVNSTATKILYTSEGQGATEAVQYILLTPDQLAALLQRGQGTNVTEVVGSAYTTVANQVFDQSSQSVIPQVQNAFPITTTLIGWMDFLYKNLLVVSLCAFGVSSALFLANWGHYKEQIKKWIISYLGGEVSPETQAEVAAAVAEIQVQQAAVELPVQMQKTIQEPVLAALEAGNKKVQMVMDVIREKGRAVMAEKHKIITGMSAPKQLPPIQTQLDRLNLYSAMESEKALPNMLGWFQGQIGETLPEGVVKEVFYYCQEQHFSYVTSKDSILQNKYDTIAEHPLSYLEEDFLKTCKKPEDLINILWKDFSIEQWSQVFLFNFNKEDLLYHEGLRNQLANRALGFLEALRIELRAAEKAFFQSEFSQVNLKNFLIQKYSLNPMQQKLLEGLIEKHSRPLAQNMKVDMFFLEFAEKHVKFLEDQVRGVSEEPLRITQARERDFSELKTEKSEIVTAAQKIVIADEYFQPENYTQQALIEWAGRETSYWQMIPHEFSNFPNWSENVWKSKRLPLDPSTRWTETTYKIIFSMWKNRLNENIIPNADREYTTFRGRFEDSFEDPGRLFFNTTPLELMADWEFLAYKYNIDIRGAQTNTSYNLAKVLKLQQDILEANNVVRELQGKKPLLVKNGFIYIKEDVRILYSKPENCLSCELTEGESSVRRLQLAIHKGIPEVLARDRVLNKEGRFLDEIYLLYQQAKLKYPQLEFTEFFHHLKEQFPNMADGEKSLRGHFKFAEDIIEYVVGGIRKIHPVEDLKAVIQKVTGRTAGMSTIRETLQDLKLKVGIQGPRIQTFQSYTGLQLQQVLDYYLVSDSNFYTKEFDRKTDQQRQTASHYWDPVLREQSKMTPEYFRQTQAYRSLYGPEYEQRREEFLTWTGITLPVAGPRPLEEVNPEGLRQKMYPHLIQPEKEGPEEPIPEVEGQVSNGIEHWEHGEGWLTTVTEQLENPIFWKHKIPVFDFTESLEEQRREYLTFAEMLIKGYRANTYEEGGYQKLIFLKLIDPNEPNKGYFCEGEMPEYLQKIADTLVLLQPLEIIEHPSFLQSEINYLNEIGENMELGEQMYQLLQRKRMMLKTWQEIKNPAFERDKWIEEYVNGEKGFYWNKETHELEVLKTLPKTLPETIDVSTNIKQGDVSTTTDQSIHVQAPDSSTAVVATQQATEVAAQLQLATREKTLKELSISAMKKAWNVSLISMIVAGAAFGFKRALSGDLTSADARFIFKNLQLASPWVIRLMQATGMDRAFPDLVRSMFFLESQNSPNITVYVDQRQNIGSAGSTLTGPQLSHEQNTEVIYQAAEAMRNSPVSTGWATSGGWAEIVIRIVDLIEHRQNPNDPLRDIASTYDLENPTQEDITYPEERTS